MKVSDLIKAVGVLSDETLPPVEVVGFLNDGMAKIGNEVGAVFPFLDLNKDTEGPVFPEKWQRLLLVPFGAARVKQKDSSQFEYEDLYRQFESDLAEFATKYVVPVAYRELASQEITLPDDTKYDVTDGETLHEIANAEGTTVKKIRDKNDDEIEVKSTDSFEPSFSSHVFGNGDW